jgi:hypothetical protein
VKPPIELRNGYKDPKRMDAIHDLPCVLCFTKGFEQKSRTIAHHKIGLGMGKKASDRLSMEICDDHHNNYNPESIHVMPLKRWEQKYFTQDQLILFTDKMLGVEPLNQITNE